MTGNEILPAFLKLDKNKRIKTYTVVFQCIYKLSGKMPAWKMKKNECSSEKYSYILYAVCRRRLWHWTKNRWFISVYIIKIRLLLTVPCIFNSKILLRADIILKIICKKQWELFFIIKGALITNLKIHCHRKGMFQQW